MAYASATITLKPITVFGDKRVHRAKIVVSSYQVDGIQITPAMMGMSIIDCVIVAAIRTVVANGPVCCVWDEATNTLQALKATNGETDATTAFDVDIVVIGS